MKTRLSSIFAILTIVALSIFSSEMLAQSNTFDTADFKINIEINNNEVLLKCIKGCDWKTLNVAPNNSSVDAKGKQSNKANASGFLVAVSKNEKGIVLKGLKGTDWTELSLGCKDISCKLVVNQFGLEQ